MIADWQLAVVLWFQSWRTPLLASIAAGADFLASEYFLMVVLFLTYWCVEKSLGRRIIVFVLLTGWLNSLLKEMFHQPRPFHVSPEVRNVVFEPSYGMPSGDAMAAGSLVGPVAVRARRRWVTIAAVIYVFLVSIFRLVAGAHFPPDVLGGMLIVGLMIWAYARLVDPLEAWLSGLSLGQQIGLVIAITAVALSIHPLLVKVTSPPGLSEPVPNRDLIAQSVTALGGFLGMGIGFALESRLVRFSSDGPWWKRGLRFLVGAVVVGVIYGGGLVIREAEPAILVRLIRYSLLGFGVSFLAPWLFVRLRLSDSPTMTI